MKNTRRAYKRQQTTQLRLLLTLLAVGTASLVFFSFLSSRDMKSAQFRSSWARQVETVLDRLSQELENAAVVEFPSQGEGPQCAFRRATADWTLGAAVEIDSFLFAENSLYHMIRTASGTTPAPRPIGNLTNPLISGVQGGVFERVAPRLLKLRCRVQLPDKPEIFQPFERLIHLRNQ
ncbi:MAG TPA: hypothetical protein PKO06_00225 [Candidatus Ozemobacteraceae bacterium]|nr:hypothetical protein [Candidatus Ozemobacteraceae bacterium]